MLQRFGDRLVQTASSLATIVNGGDGVEKGMADKAKRRQARESTELNRQLKQAAKAEQALIDREEKAARRLEKARSRLVRAERRLEAARAEYDKRTARVHHWQQVLSESRAAREAGPINTASPDDEAARSNGDAPDEAALTTSGDGSAAEASNDDEATTAADETPTVPAGQSSGDSESS